MIIPNGTIEVKRKATAGIDPETGHPRKPTPETWGEPIECQYLVDRYNAQAQVGQLHRTEQSYRILIEEQPFEADTVRLSDLAGKAIGVFPIKQIEPLAAACQIRIWV